MVCGWCNADGVSVQVKKHGYDVLRCGACGALYVPVGTSYDPKAVYGPGYLTGRYAGTESFYKDYFADEAKHRAKAQKILRIIGGDGKRGALYEMGCGPGFLLDEARKDGWGGVWGTEMSDEAVDHACKKLGLLVQMQRTPSFAMAHANVAIDVMEHIPIDEIRVIVSELYDCARSILAIETIFSDGIDDVVNWKMMQPPRHLTFLSLKEWVKLLPIVPELHNLAAKGETRLPGNPKPGVATLMVWRKNQ